METHSFALPKLCFVNKREREREGEGEKSVGEGESK